MAGETQPGQQVVELLDLVGGKRVVGLVGHRAMGPHSGQLQRVPVGNGIGQHHDFSRRRADSGHAGIDLEVDG